MESGRPPMFSQAGQEPVKFTYNAEQLLHIHKRQKQFAHNSPMEWDEKAATDDQNMDCSEDSYIDVSKAKVSSQNLRMKGPERTEAITEPDHHANFVNDIDKRLAGKKVAQLPEENVAATFGNFLGLQHKSLPQKHTMVEHFDKVDTAQTLDHIKFKMTTDLLQKVNSGTTPDKVICIPYNPKFTSIENLRKVPDAQISSGSFGVVMKVRDSVTKQVMVLKKVKKNHTGQFELAVNEVLVPIQLPDAENIAQFYGLSWNGDELNFMMEDAGTSLRMLIQDKVFILTLEEPDKLEKVMLDIFCAISHLARHGVTHCDIKPENICLNQETWLAKLVDFGSSKTKQDKMNYKGVTPEYLDPLANKFMYEFFVRENKTYPPHKLEEKDDVFSAGLVGLFLIMRAHPMIQFFTGAPDYPKDQTANAKRMEVLKKISELSEDMLLKLIDRPMSVLMKELMLKVLDPVRDRRWQASKAALFLKEKLCLGTQPPNKLRKQAPQPSHSPSEDPAMFIDLRIKNPDQRSDKQELSRQPSDCGHSPDPEQRMGIAFKGNVGSNLVGGVLMPAKLKMPIRQQGEMSQVTAAAAHLTESALSRQQTHYQPFVQQELQHKLMKDEESSEYSELVNSFTAKPAQDKSRNFVPFLLAQRFKAQPYQVQGRQVGQSALLPSSAQKVFSVLNPAAAYQGLANEGSVSHAILPQGPTGQVIAFAEQTGQIVAPQGSTGQIIAPQGPAGKFIAPQEFSNQAAAYPGSAIQEEQQQPAAIHGLFGCLFKVPGSDAGPPVGTDQSFGNVPNMDALFCEELERQNRKIMRRKATRENRNWTRDGI